MLTVPPCPNSFLLKLERLNCRRFQEMSSSNDNKIAELQRHFGGALDSEVLLSVLAMVDGSVAEAKQFLEGQGHEGGAQAYVDLCLCLQQSVVVWH